MTVTLKDAVEALHARESALGPQRVIRLADAPRLFIGLDVQVGDLFEVAEDIAVDAIVLVAFGVDVQVVVQSTFVTGLAAGLLWADMRAREESRASASEKDCW